VKDYEVKYKDEDGCAHEAIVTAQDVRTAINNAFELHKDCVQVIRAYPKPMFED